MTELTFELYDGIQTRGLASSVVVPLYEAANADLLTKPFYTAERFTERLNGYTGSPGFGLVVARETDGTAVAQAFGYALPPRANWWRGLIDPVPDGFTDEDGVRTFALNEIMVVPERRRRGIARAVHDALLASRPERRATLLVDADNEPAATAYRNWGWRSVARLQPFPDAPVYTALITDLPLPTG